MEFIELIHEPVGEIFDFQANVFIAASGYESRSIIIPKALGPNNAIKVAFAFKEFSKELARSGNDQFFQKNQFELIHNSGNEAPDYESIFSRINGHELKVMIDISVMTRRWYHSFLRYFLNTRRFQKVHIRVVYCPALYSDPLKPKRAVSLEKFIMAEKIRERVATNKNTALIMGLGNEKGVSQTVYELIKPDSCSLLYADPTIQKEYVENVFVSNHGLINQIDIRNLMGYPLNDTEQLYRMLVNLVLPLRADYQVVIIPQGPKIFSLITMILQMSYPDIDLLYPKFKVRHIRDRIPFYEFTSLDLIFGTE